MAIHCKSCRRDLEASAYGFDKTRKRKYKTCDECRAKRNAKPRKKRTKITLAICKQFAISRGGLCLSTSYKNNHQKMNWKCSEGHEWKAIFGNIKLKNSWCPKCHGNEKLNIEKCKQFAISKGGECLSKTYKNCLQKMKWRCSEGHEWTTSFSSIKNVNTWCPTCVGKKKLTIEECQEVARSRNGLCLSKTYKNAFQKLKWKCDKNHEWVATFNGIKNGNSWCPQCSAGKSEQLCREIFEKYLLEKFPNVRPKWLGGLELDGYNKELKIAFEYNGKQHYKYIPYFHRNGKKDFKSQQERDKRKIQLCVEHGVKLISIPYKFNCQNPDELESFIYRELWKIC
jgi:hypothetical protein